MAATGQQKKAKRAVLITGAARRIGKGIALDLARQGYAVGLHHHSSLRAARKIQKSVRNSGGTCELFCCDLSDSGACTGLVRSVQGALGRLDVLINNASVFQPSPICSDRPGKLDESLDIHLKAPYLLTGEFVRTCKKGLVINMLDSAIVKNQGVYGDYLLSKKALAELTRMSAIAFSPSVRVNAIAPGFILPPESPASFSQTDRLKNIPLRKKGKLTHILQAVRYLIVNDFVTGQILFVDGGEHLT